MHTLSCSFYYYYYYLIGIDRSKHEDNFTFPPISHIPPDLCHLSFLSPSLPPSDVIKNHLEEKPKNRCCTSALLSDTQRPSSVDKQLIPAYIQVLLPQAQHTY